jgi:hypothetical protein
LLHRTRRTGSLWCIALACHVPGWRAVHDVLATTRAYTPHWQLGIQCIGSLRGSG